MALFLAPSSQSKIGNNNGLIFVTKIETQIFKMSLAVHPVLSFCSNFSGQLTKRDISWIHNWLIFGYLSSVDYF
jgi:hypothetical protein